MTDIKRNFLKYVSLNVIGMIGLSCYILADTFFVARGIGSEGLTALNIAIPVYSFINGTGLMIGIGGATRFAISKSKTVFTQSIFYVILTSILFLCVGLLFSEKLAYILGADAHTVGNANVYLKTILCFAPMFLLNNVIICFIRNDGNPKLSMTAMLIGSLSNIVLDYVFIFHFNMGMFGAAFATGIAPIISLLVMLPYFIKKKNTFAFKKEKLKPKALGDISSLGISALITEFSSGIVIIVFNIIILNVAGNIGVAAYGIIANIALVIIAVFTGISQGMQPIISKCYGSNNKKDIRKVMKYGGFTAVTIAILVYVLSVIFAKDIVGAFNKDADVTLAQIAINGIYIYFTAFIFVGINILLATYYSAVDMPKKAFAISMLRGIVIITPMAICLSTAFGINGVWCAMVVTEIIVCMFATSKIIFKKKAAFQVE